jgi:D-arabinose 5-phosphate isomerase GutQ
LILFANLTALTQGLGDLMSEVKGRLGTQGHVQVVGAGPSTLSKRTSSAGMNRRRNKRYVVSGSDSSSDDTGIIEVRHRTHRLSARERIRLPAFTGKET